MSGNSPLTGPGALIEFGTTPTGDAPVCCYVRDNGAGFDPLYVSTLFQPSSGCHWAGEFPGTGIGLISVRQIIKRHGGQTWARAGWRGPTIRFHPNAEETDHQPEPTGAPDQPGPPAPPGPPERPEPPEPREQQESPEPQEPPGQQERPEPPETPGQPERPGQPEPPASQPPERPGQPERPEPQGLQERPEPLERPGQLLAGEERKSMTDRTILLVEDNPDDEARRSWPGQMGLNGRCEWRSRSGATRRSSPRRRCSALHRR